MGVVVRGRMPDKKRILRMEGFWNTTQNVDRKKDLEWSLMMSTGTKAKQQIFSTIVAFTHDPSRYIRQQIFQQIFCFIIREKAGYRFKFELKNFKASLSGKEFEMLQ